MNEINWKLRFQNKATLVALLGAVVAFAYQGFSMIGYVPPVSSDQWIQLGSTLINVLVIMGIVVDPTTKGIKDSPTAQAYEEPKEH